MGWSGPKAALAEVESAAEQLLGFEEAIGLAQPERAVVEGRGEQIGLGREEGQGNAFRASADGFELAEARLIMEHETPEHEGADEGGGIGLVFLADVQEIVEQGLGAGP